MTSQSLLELKTKIDGSFVDSDAKLVLFRLIALVESELNHMEYSKRESNARHDVYADVCNKLLVAITNISTKNY